MYVTERFTLPRVVDLALRHKPPRFGFDGFGEIIYQRTYSRVMDDGRQEIWADTVKRVVEGVLSIRKTHYLHNGLRWDEEKWTQIAIRMANAIFSMRFLPPGRGLWAMGTPYLAERGALSLYNCAATEVSHLSHDAGWVMDCLMCGVGVGFSTVPTTDVRLSEPARWNGPGDVVRIPDTREGWVDSVERVIGSYEDGSPEVLFDYSQIRGAGEPIRGFGGTAAGPGPLQDLHRRLRAILGAHTANQTTDTQLIADVMNSIGVCVVAGNVRRSAEIALGRVDDDTFTNLKNPSLFPERQDIAWMSNNSVVLQDHDDFLALPKIADRIRENGEPGVFNLVNIQKFGRLFRESVDYATLTNPCGEIPLEDKETCNLVEVFPTRCGTAEEIVDAVELAAIYASTVALLPTHRSETNEIVARNRRIGVSMSGIADWTEYTPIASCTRILRDAYRLVRATNEKLAREAGVPPSIRLTTVKPSGTVSLLAGVSSGMHWPTFRYAIRRVRVGEYSPITPALIDAGIPYEEDQVSRNTLVFEFPIDQSKTRPTTEVSIWQQASRVAWLQREWADNMVSNTLYFDPVREGRDVEQVLAEFAPLVKTMSLLPHTPAGAYPQMPYEEITAQEYGRRREMNRPIDWSRGDVSDGAGVRFCDNGSCAV